MTSASYSEVRTGDCVSRTYDHDREAMRSLLARIGDKWSVLIVVLLGDGAKRFCEIQRAVGGITQKVLSRTLRALERDGLIKRTLVSALPVRVEYELTCLGRSLWTVLEPLGAWAHAHVRRVNMARVQYDERERQKLLHR